MSDRDARIERAVEVLLADIARYDPKSEAARVMHGVTGRALPEVWHRQTLERLKAAASAPEICVVEVEDTIEQLKREPRNTRECVLLTQDINGYRLGYDPDGGAFLLVRKTASGSYATMNIYGDAVGCFGAM